MKHIWILALVLNFGTATWAQEDEEETFTETEEVDRLPSSDKEIGFDVNFSASNFGGTGGIGLKLGFIQQEKFIVGPSIRYQYAWSNGIGVNGNPGINTSFSIYGGGGFAHARFYNYFFAGVEAEVLSTPFLNGFLTTQRRWVPVALIGGGFSRAFTSGFRLNAGVMYDVVNDLNSPLRQGYFMKRSNGTYIPVMYRIAFFFAI